MSAKLYLDQWWKFVQENPDVCDLFNEFALKEIAETEGPVQSWAVVKKLNTHRKSQGKKPINNNHIAFFIRQFVRDHPEHADKFKVLPLKYTTKQELKDHGLA